jgi:hypothetical protein
MGTSEWFFDQQPFEQWLHVRPNAHAQTSMDLFENNTLWVQGQHSYFNPKVAS